MLSYVDLGTNDLERATRFYDATLAPLGMPRCVTGDPEWNRISAGWGIYENGGARELGFWIGKPFNQQPASVGNGSMSRSALARGKLSTTSIPLLLQMAVRATVLPVCD